MKSNYKTIRVSIEVSDEDGLVLQSTFRSEGDMTLSDMSVAIDRMTAACLADAKSKAYSIEAREYSETQAAAEVAK